MGTIDVVGRARPGEVCLCGCSASDAERSGARSRWRHSNSSAGDTAPAAHCPSCENRVDHDFFWHAEYRAGRDGLLSLGSGAPQSGACPLGRRAPEGSSSDEDRDPRHRLDGAKDVLPPRIRQVELELTAIFLRAAERAQYPPLPAEALDHLVESNEIVAAHAFALLRHGDEGVADAVGLVLDAASESLAGIGLETDADLVWDLAIEEDIPTEVLQRARTHPSEVPFLVLRHVLRRLLPLSSEAFEA